MAVLSFCPSCPCPSLPFAGANVIRVACWAHARRKSYDARHTDPLPAHQALARIGRLYAIEESCKSLSAEERYVIRQPDAVHC
jgi:hypothetical protein